MGTMQTAFEHAAGFDPNKYKASQNRYQQYGNSYQNHGGYDGYKRSARPPKRQIPVLEELPEDYVGAAEKIMHDHWDIITTSKIRNILSMVNDIYNVESVRTEENLTKESMSKIQQLRVRLIYECGRDEKSVGKFIELTHMINYLLAIGSSREKFIRYAKYVEALVAYQRYFGGREN